MEIKERKESLEYIANAYGKYKTLFHEGKSIMLLIDPASGSILDANIAASKFYGYSIDELKSMNIKQINVYKDKIVHKQMQKVLDNEEGHFFFKHRLANGVIRDVEVYSGKVDSNGKYVLYSIIYDITESKRNADRFKDAEKIANIGSWEYDVSTKKFYASEGARKIYGVESEIISIEQIQGSALPEFREMLVKKVRDLISNDIPYDIKFRILRSFDDKVIDIHSIAQYDKESNVVTGVIKDITERKKIEEDLRNAKQKAEESDRLKSAFLAIVSHELRTPLNAIIGLSDLIKEGVDEDEMREMNSKINSSGYKLLDIIETILDISLVETGRYRINKERFKLSDLYADIQEYIMQENANDKEVKILFKPQANLEKTSIFSDYKKVKKVVKNLVSNSIKYTDKGCVEYGYYTSNNNIIFYVKDTGAGIPKDKEDVIFESFRRLDESLTRKYEGIGLGLTVCKRITDVLNARLWFRSEEGKGTVFFFKLDNVDINYI